MLCGNSFERREKSKERTHPLPKPKSQRDGPPRSISLIHFFDDSDRVCYPLSQVTVLRTVVNRSLVVRRRSEPRSFAQPSSLGARSRRPLSNQPIECLWSGKRPACP